MGAVQIIVLALVTVSMAGCLIVGIKENAKSQN